MAAGMFIVDEIPESTMVCNDLVMPWPVFRQGRARVADLLALAGRILGPVRAARLPDDDAQRRGATGIGQRDADAQRVRHVETELAGAIDSASARAMVAGLVEEEPPGLDDVLRIPDQASQLRPCSLALEKASAELRAVDLDPRAGRCRCC